AAILLLLLVAVELGGGSLLTLLTPLHPRLPGQPAAPAHVAGGARAHAPPGRGGGRCWACRDALCRLKAAVRGLKSLVRVTLLVAPILVSFGFSCRCWPPSGSDP